MAKSRGYRGGLREGTPGQVYSNRTDLNNKLPVTTAPGQQYGMATQQAAAQKAVPMASGPPTQIAQAQQNAGSPPPLPQAGPATAALGVPGPGSFPPLSAPTDRPNEPVTHGANAGPGAGPEALMGYQTPKVSKTIAQIASMSGNPDLLALAQRAVSQGN